MARDPKDIFAKRGPGRPPRVAAPEAVLAAAGIDPATVLPSGSPASADDDDAALGIGVEMAEMTAPGVDFDALMASPAFAAAVEKAVAARLGAPAATGSEAAFNAFLSKFDHMLEASNEQKAGYIKPLTAAEVDRRKAGQAEMKRLLVACKADNVWPQYLLADEANPFYGPSPNGPILYDAGQTINWRGPPAESFKPLNDAAIEIYAAYKQWIGEVISIEDLTRQAVIDARGPAAAPEYKFDAGDASDIQLVDGEKRDVAPKRTLGTLVPELRGQARPGQPGIAAQPAGPIFVDG